MEAMKRTRKPWWFWAIVVLAVFAVGVAGYGVLHGREIINLVHLQTAKAEQFPEYEEGELTQAQLKLVSILKQEYAMQPAGTKYAEGTNEPWCADFASWIMREYGVPFSNPNSGSWRIPGTITLREYFTQQGVWHAYGDGYQPKTGDIAIYDGNGPFGQHTNFVMRNDSGELTTVGGNEAGAIHVQRHRLNDDLHVLGFASVL